VICIRNNDVYRLRLFIKKHKEVLSLFGCLVLYGFLAFLFDIPCPIKASTGISCPGCGMSRALISMLTLDFSSAIYYHPLVFFVIPVCVSAVVFYERKMKKAQQVLIWLCVIALVSVYLYRMIAVTSPVVVFAPENSNVAKFFSWAADLFR